MKWKTIKFGKLFFSYDENYIKNKFYKVSEEEFKKTWEKFKKHIENGRSI